MNLLVVEPGMAPYEKEIAGLSEMQTMVCGEMLEKVRDTARNMGNGIEQAINPRQQERGSQNRRHSR